MPDLKTRMEAIEERINYRFNNPDLLKSALTHSSANTDFSNERMEFLGDRVLGLVMSDFLYNNFIEEEGCLAKRLNYWVSRSSCAEVAMNINLGKAIILAPSEEDNGGRKKETILGNACEAVIAAVYLDGGFEKANKVVLHLWDNLINRPIPMTDSKSALQEWSQSFNLGLPKYKIVERTGPDHAPTFKVSVEIKNNGHAIGEGGSRRAAEHDAAKQMLVKINEEEDFF
ncbi:MAG: ribonuclease III [Pseudomonadota bacterium]